METEKGKWDANCPSRHRKLKTPLKKKKTENGGNANCIRHATKTGQTVRMDKRKQKHAPRKSG